MCVLAYILIFVGVVLGWAEDLAPELKSWMCFWQVFLSEAGWLAMALRYLYLYFGQPRYVLAGLSKIVVCIHRKHWVEFETSQSVVHKKALFRSINIFGTPTTSFLSIVYSSFILCILWGILILYADRIIPYICTKYDHSGKKSCKTVFSECTTIIHVPLPLH